MVLIAAQLSRPFRGRLPTFLKLLLLTVLVSAALFVSFIPSLHLPYGASIGLRQHRHHHLHHVDSSHAFFVPHSYGKWSQYIVYKCDGSFACGGWADRQKGIVAAYIISVMTQRKFKVILTIPCDVRTYLLPVKEDWRVHGNELQGKPSTDVIKLDSEGINFCNRLGKERLEDIFKSNVTYININIECVKFLLRNPLYSHQLDWAKGKSVGEIYRLVWNSLFKLNQKTGNHLRTFRSQISRSKTLVCSQIRVGYSPTIPEDRVINTLENVEAVWNFLKKYNDSDRYHIFLTTDSEQVRDIGRLKFPDVNLELKGHIVHVDRTRGDHVCDGLEKTLLDQIVLSTCDVLIISESGFGRIAAFMRQSQDNLYCINVANITKCTETSRQFIRGPW
ncbi:uncharacterized protein LOC124281321 [Haliotis rubra]|uniref:uncharacterized protein LOC124281321 n=1 Tax=Haliotis rubra TaxID=36100 RepID=UPI001EE61438|nr:uncharacterized protein LOC124281321 [Haliotis rubra]XP_046573304.1 uncharacterized protein LOC124281321 [Haliotis rubra]